MATVEERVPPLVPGDRLTVGEFLRRWEAMPAVKQADLIGGIVYMPSPLSRDHAIMHCQVNTWIGHYAAFTPGCEPADNGTWIMSKVDAPQPHSTLQTAKLQRQITPQGRSLTGMPPLLGRRKRGQPGFCLLVLIQQESFRCKQFLPPFELGASGCLLPSPLWGRVRVGG